MDGECAICLSPLEEGSTRFPGCEHSFHTVCLLDLARLQKVKCPVCRHVPEGMRAAAAEEGDLRHALERLRRERRNYAQRRRRFLSSRPHLKEKDETLKEVRAAAAKLVQGGVRLCEQKCKEMWRNDSEVRSIRKEVANLRRRERKLEAVLAEEVDPFVPPPFPAMMMLTDD